MEVVKYVSQAGDQIELSPAVIKSYLVSGDASRVSDQEVQMFLELCKFQKLNPFLREAYLIKYGTAPATIVTGKETFLKRAVRNPKYQGHETGISDDNKKAWAKVYVEGYRVPVCCEVNYSEYVGKKSNGEPTKMWSEKPRTMLKKVALVQALREAFPDDFGGMYSPEEINTIRQELPDEPIDVTPPKTSSVKPAEEPIANEKAKKKDLDKQKEKLEEGDDEPIKDKLKRVLRAYCGSDMIKQQEVLKEISRFKPTNGDEKWIDDIEASTDKWCNSSYGKLKKLIEKDYPKGCTIEPDVCNMASFEDEMAYCSTTSEVCPFQKDKF